MRWQGRAGSGNIEDRRGMGMALPIGGGIGGLVLLLLFSALTGQNPADLINVANDQTTGTSGVRGDDPQAEFVSVVLADLEDTWSEIFRARSDTYTPPTLVLFTQATQSACGLGQSAMGPFYCPSDRKVYLDLSFFHDLENRFGAPGDFAQAYVIAHEFGHHVQDALGIFDGVQSQQQSDPSKANELSIRLELQADCLAGVWAHSIWAQPDQSDVESITEADVREALTAAAAVGDDRIQEQATGTINKETWTHGSADQRTTWFSTGFRVGTTESCDTFSVATP